MAERVDGIASCRPQRQGAHRRPGNQEHDKGGCQKDTGIELCSVGEQLQPAVHRIPRQWRRQHRSDQCEAQRFL